MFSLRFLFEVVLAKAIKQLSNMSVSQNAFAKINKKIEITMINPNIVNIVYLFRYSKVPVRSAKATNRQNDGTMATFPHEFWRSPGRAGYIIINQMARILYKYLVINDAKVSNNGQFQRFYHK